MKPSCKTIATFKLFRGVNYQLEFDKWLKEHPEVKIVCQYFVRYQEDDCLCVMYEFQKGV